MSNAAINARIADVHAAIRAARKPVPATHVRDALGWRHLPVWEIEQLEARGAIRRVPNSVGSDCVDGRYESVPMAQWKR